MVEYLQLTKIYEIMSWEKQTGGCRWLIDKKVPDNQANGERQVW